MFFCLYFTSFLFVKGLFDHVYLSGRDLICCMAVCIYCQEHQGIEHSGHSASIIEQSSNSWTDLNALNLSSIQGQIFLWDLIHFSVVERYWIQWDSCISCFTPPLLVLSQMTVYVFVVVVHFNFQYLYHLLQNDTWHSASQFHN